MAEQDIISSLESVPIEERKRHYPAPISELISKCEKLCKYVTEKNMYFKFVHDLPILSQLYATFTLAEYTFTALDYYQHIKFDQELFKLTFIEQFQHLVNLLNRHGYDAKFYIMYRDEFKIEKTFKSSINYNYLNRFIYEKCDIVHVRNLDDTRDEVFKPPADISQQKACEIIKL